MKKKIYLIGLIYNNNLGDPIIYQACKYMIDEIIGENEEYEVISLDLFGREPMGYNPVIERLRSKEGYYTSNNKDENKTREATLISRTICGKISKDNSCIIFVGGGIVKYVYEKFEIYIDQITKYAEDNSIPVMFNAVGIEGFDDNNESCIVLKNALNRECVKMITVRDDLDTLLDKYEYKGYAKRVADSACYISKYVNLSLAKKEKIGINCARPELFKEYGVDFERDKIAKLMAETVISLTSRGYKCELFDNGTLRDDMFVDEILGIIGENNKVSRRNRPSTGYELVQMINDYKAIIATRLHASIVAFSCGVPFVSLVWNNKQAFFCQSINKNSWYISSSEFDSNYIADRLEDAMREGYGKVSIDKQCAETIMCLDRFIKGAFTMGN